MKDRDTEVLMLRKRKNLTRWGWSTVDVRCPYCKQVHRYGISTDGEPARSYRAAQCDESRGFYLVTKLQLQDEKKND